jgi:hypothetical protein
MIKNKFLKWYSGNNLFALILVLMFTSCTYDEFDFQESAPQLSCDTINQITFSEKAGLIIAANCALSCHVIGGTAPGNFNNYMELKEKVIDGSFENRVFILKDMPPDYSPGPKFLNDCDLEILKAWINAGFPE